MTVSVTADSGPWGPPARLGAASAPSALWAPGAQLMWNPTAGNWELRVWMPV
ncbi:MAG: hypothetical protein PHQ28_04150 [Mycobacterium sp.]|nr:hypothetical protein [Mycobacterium sp.]